MANPATAGKYDVSITLDNSDFARCYTGKERIHQEEMEQVTALLDAQLQKAAESKASRDDSVYVEHHYNTIAIFGARGTGKSSFLYSILKEYGDAHKKEVYVLPVIDPTMIEEKGHVFLLIVSLINRLIVDRLGSDELDVSNRAYAQRREWNASLRKLAYGMPQLDKVGKGLETECWEDADFIMERGLEEVSSAFDLERNFHALIHLALEILDKKAFLFSFDDIDVDMKKGWPVIETLRKYLTTPQTLTLLSGNFSLYSNIVRLHQWEQMRALKDYENHDNKYRQQVDDLENQYLLKVFKAQNRIHLLSLREMSDKGVNIQVDGLSIKQCYEERLTKMGIANKSVQNMFIRFLLGLSVRSQIQFLRNAGGQGKGKDTTAFASAMYASNIPVDFAEQTPSKLGTITAQYLYQQNIWAEHFLLVPLSEDEYTSSCLAGLTTLFASGIAAEPYALFDYMLRVAYIGNILQAIGNAENIQKLLDTNRLLQGESLKNMIGQTMAFMDHSRMDTAEHTKLYGRQATAKKKLQDRIDAVLSEANHLQRLIGMLPMASLGYATKNESHLYYSIFMLLSSISEIMRYADVADGMQTMANSVSYFVDLQGGDSDFDSIPFAISSATDTEKSQEASDQLKNFVKAVEAWKGKYPFGADKTTSAYLIGRIVTRFYGAAKNIVQADLGEQMEKTVVCFLNACLIEEGSATIADLNRDNAVNNVKVFNDNLGKVTSMADLPLTHWLASCPLLYCFVDENLFNTLKDKAGLGAELATLHAGMGIKNLLCKVEIQPRVDATKPIFSGTKKRIKATVDYLKAKNFDIEANIINVTDDKQAADKLNESKLFGAEISVAKVATFRKNYAQHDV